VRRAIDGDTIELTDGRLVRYLGIDAPEVRRRAGGTWVLDPEPMGLEATEANRRLVEGRRVRLEYDARSRDRFGRLLAYVYVGDTMANAELLRLGLARPLILPPNAKYEEHFRRLADEAQRQGRGMWGRRVRASEPPRRDGGPAEAGSGPGPQPIPAAAGTSGTGAD